MKKLILEDNLVDPKEVKLPYLDNNNIFGTKTNYNLLVDINSAAESSKKISKIKIVNSNGTTVSLEFQPNTQDSIKAFSTQLSNKGYQTGNTGNKIYTWNNFGYKVTNTSQENTQGFSGMNTNIKPSSSEGSDDYEKQAEDMLIGSLAPVINQLYGGVSQSTKSEVTENIIRIKKLMNL